MSRLQPPKVTISRLVFNVESKVGNFQQRPQTFFRFTWPILCPPEWFTKKSPMYDVRFKG